MPNLALPPVFPDFGLIHHWKRHERVRVAQRRCAALRLHPPARPARRGDAESQLSNDLSNAVNLAMLVTLPQTSANSNGVNTLSLSVSGPPTQAEVQTSVTPESCGQSQSSPGASPSSRGLLFCRRPLFEPGNRQAVAGCRKPLDTEVVPAAHDSGVTPVQTLVNAYNDLVNALRR